MRAGGTFVNAWADYDGDGDPDLFVGFDGAPNRLYRNDNGTFADAAGAAGMADARPTRAAAWGDADARWRSGSAGRLHAGRGRASVLRLVPQCQRSCSATTLRLPDFALPTGAVRQPAWIDFDGDGDLDLFVAFRDKANTLFRNDGGRFGDVAAELGLADARRTVGAVWFDYDEDGDLDVIAGNMDGDANGLFSYGDGRFTDVAEQPASHGAAARRTTRRNGTVRPCVADVNNDGHFDLFFANYGKNGLFLNRGKGRFVDVSAVMGH